MPATGSSSSSSCGSCISSMPISSHCFWPCEQADRRGRLASVRELDRVRGCARMRPCAVESSFARERRPDALVGLARELEVLEHRVTARTPSASGTCDRCRDRRFPARSARVRSIVWPKNAVPAVGSRLAGDHVHHRRLAGAVGADHAAELAGVDRRATDRSSALKPSKLTEIDVEIQNAAMARVDAGRARRGRRRCPRCGLAAAR